MAGRTPSFDQDVEAVSRDFGIPVEDVDEDMVVTGEYYWESEDGYHTYSDYDQSFS